MSLSSKHIATVMWRAFLQSVTQVSDYVYSIVVQVVDVNQPGAGELELGYWFKDNIGHTYQIIEIIGNVIKVQDILLVGVCNQCGFEGVVYKSVQRGAALFIAPINCYQFLDPCAREYSLAIESDIFWNNDSNAKRILINSNTPLLADYQTNYADDYGENPDIKLFQINEDGNFIERTERPYFVIENNLIKTITFGELESIISGYIKISRQ